MVFTMIGFYGFIGFLWATAIVGFLIYDDLKTDAHYIFSWQWWIFGIILLFLCHFVFWPFGMKYDWNFWNRR